MENCLFCKIIDKKTPAKIVYENEYVIAFLDINPISNGHCIVIPKKHFASLQLTDERYLQEVSIALKIVANKLYNSKLKPWGMNYLSNENSIAGQEIFHFHFHIIPKYFANEGLILKTNPVHNKDIEEIYKLINI
ncbi:MAG: HIT family protein [Malacoplasma sp.]